MSKKTSLGEKSLGKNRGTKLLVLIKEHWGASLERGIRQADSPS